MAAEEKDFKFSTKKFDAEEVRVLRYTATEGISQCFTYDLELEIYEIDVAFDDIIGEPGTLDIHTAHGQRLVHGIIARWEETGRNKAVTYYSVRLVPRVWTLTLKRQSRIFQQMSTPDILKKVLEEAGLSSDMFRLSLQGKYAERKYCVQYRESDFDFINRLMEEEGIFFFFEHTDDQEVLVLGDVPEVHGELPEDPILRYREGEAGMLSEETITQFRYARTLRTGAVALKEFDFLKPSLKLQSEQKHKSDKEKKFESYDYPGEFHVPSLGDQLAKVRLEEERAESYLGVGETDCRRMESGWKFTMEDHPRDEMNGPYVVLRVRHIGQQPHAGAGAGEGGENKKVYHAIFECIPFAVPFRPPRLTPRPHIDGPQTAMVVGPQNEEIHCDEHGRVKVKFHWDRLGAADDKASCWIRVTQSWGGEGYGSMIIPRVGQEVVVEFLEGDPDRPLVTGRVYNGTSVPPYALPANKTITTMKSTSSPGGGGANEIAFEDKKGSEKFFLQAEKDHHLNVKNDAYESVGHDEHITIARDSITAVGRDVHELIERDELVDVGRDQSVNIGGKQMEHVAGTRTMKVAGDVHETFGANISTDVGGSYLLKAGKSLVIDAGTDITLKVGGNFVLIDSSGVTVVGSKINLNSGGSAKTVKAVKAVPAVKPKKATAADHAPEGKTAKGATGSLAGAAAAAIKAAQRDSQPTHKDPPKGAPAEKGKTWIEFLLQDANKEPVAGEPWEVELPDKKIATGTTGADGLVRVEGVDPGSCKIRFPRLDKDSWRKA